MESGHRVVGLGRNEHKASLLMSKGMVFWKSDLRGPVLMPKEHQDLDGVIHCAGFSSAWGTRRDFFEINVTGTTHALELARQCKTRRFVFISSPSVAFQFADQFDLSEERAAHNPVNAYAWSKLAAEQIVIAAKDLDPVILRPRGIYGAGDPSLLPRLVRAVESGPLPLLRGGRALTHLTYVGDAARAAVAAMELSPNPGKRVFNITGPETLSVKEIIEAAAAKKGLAVRWKSVPWLLCRTLVGAAETFHKVAMPDIEPRITAYGLGTLAFSQTLDIRAAANYLSFSPRVAFADGLKLTFEQG